MTRLLYFIIIVSFLDTFIQLPIITPYAMGMGATHAFTGAIVAVYSLTNMFGNVLGGHWIDQFGRKKMLLFGMISVAVILLLYPLASSGAELFAIRFFHGLAGGVLIPAAFAYVGDQTIKGNRGKTMAFTGAAIGGAAIIGPAIGGIMAARSKVEYVFILVAILFMISIYLVIRFIPETLKKSDRGQVSMRDFIPLLKNPILIKASLAAFALMVSNGTLAFALPLKVETLGMDTSTTGMLLSVFGITALIVFLTPIHNIFEKVKAINLIIIGLCLIGIALFYLSFINDVFEGYIAMVIYGLGFALIFPSMNEMVADASTKSDRGKANGIFYAFFSLGVVAGSSISGVVSEIYGIPFIISACIMLSCGIVLIILSKRKSVS